MTSNQKSKKYVIIPFAIVLILSVLAAISFAKIVKSEKDINSNQLGQNRIAPSPIDQVPTYPTNIKNKDEVKSKSKNLPLVYPNLPWKKTVLRGDMDGYNINGDRVDLKNAYMYVSEDLDFIPEDFMHYYTTVFVDDGWIITMDGARDGAESYGLAKGTMYIMARYQCTVEPVPLKCQAMVSHN